jgi:hypothetical protein
MRYSLSYDLITPGKDYEKLWNALKEFGAKRLLESQWGFRRVNTTAAGLRDYFKQFIDSNDRLVVLSVDSGEWATWNAKTKIPDL